MTAHDQPPGATAECGKKKKKKVEFNKNIYATHEIRTFWLTEIQPYYRSLIKYLSQGILTWSDQAGESGRM